MKTQLKFFATAIFLFLLLFITCDASAQALSRWKLGRPSLMIDLPGEPRAEDVAWAERPVYSIFPNAWSAEGSGVRVEVARIYTAKTPADLLTEIGQKLSVSPSVQNKGMISGREFVNSSNGSRSIAVIGKDSNLSSGATWVIVAAYQNQAGVNLASRIFSSLQIEREGGRNWALRSFGNSYLMGELPFELTEFRRHGEAEKFRRYETNFDGMDVKVTLQTANENSVFNTDDTINGIIEKTRSTEGVTEFRSSYSKAKLGDKAADLITMDFKRNYRTYRLYELAYLEKEKAVLASIEIDPNIADHVKAAERILRSVRLSNTIIYGWKTFPVGDKGLFMDLPKSPGAPKQQNAVSVYSVDSGLAMVEIRELETGFPTAHDPDLTAKSYFDIQNSISSAKMELVGIEKRLVDGLEARLIKATWKNGNFTNQRQILMILGYETQWIIDVLAAKETVDYLERVLQSVRIQVPASGNFSRHSFGKMGVSFLPASEITQTKSEDLADDPDLSHEFSAFNEFPGGIFIIYELTFKNQALDLTEQRAMNIAGSLLKGMGSSAGITITPTLGDRFPINVDGVEGLHLILDLKSSNNNSGNPIQGDFLMLRQGKQLWTMLLSTNYGSGLEARRNRARILNSLRVGL